MGAHDRRADSLGVVDDGVPLGTQFVDEAADAQFVVGVAALECSHFGMNEGFEFRGTGDGALDAFVHRGDFPAHRLADGHNAFGCDGFRFGEAQGDLSHGTGCVAEVVRARHHDREGEEEHDRQEGADENGDDAGHGDDVGDRRRLPDGAAVEQLGQAQSAKDPETRYDGCVA